MTDTGEWLISTAKQNPEALLVLAAGCALQLKVSRYASASNAAMHPVPALVTACR